MYGEYVDDLRCRDGGRSRRRDVRILWLWIFLGAGCGILHTMRFWELLCFDGLIGSMRRRDLFRRGAVILYQLRCRYLRCHDGAEYLRPLS